MRASLWLMFCVLGHDASVSKCVCGSLSLCSPASVIGFLRIGTAGAGNFFFISMGGLQEISSGEGREVSVG